MESNGQMKEMTIRQMFYSLKRNGFVCDGEKYEIGDISEKTGLEKVDEGEWRKPNEDETDSLGSKIIEIQSVSEIKDEDFYNPNQSFKLPAISSNEWKNKVGIDKQILLKKHTIERNIKGHEEFKNIDKEILDNALYGNDQVLYCQPLKRPNYYSVVKNGDYYDVATIDIDKNKKYAEVVDWRRISLKSLKKMKKQEEKGKIESTLVGGQSNITSDCLVVARAAVLNSALQGALGTYQNYQTVKTTAESSEINSLNKKIAQLTEKINSNQTNDNAPTLSELFNLIKQGKKIA